MMNTMMSAMMKAINNTEKYYVAEIIGSNVIRVTGNFAYEGDAIEAKRRMSRRDKGNYIVKTV